MRKILAPLLGLLMIMAGCTPPPFPAAVATPAPTSPAAEDSARAPAAVTSDPGEPAVPAATVPATPAVAPAPTAPLDDHTQPSLSITVDPPEVAWDSQAIVTVRASDPAGIKALAVMLDDQVLATGDGEELQLDFIPGAVDGLVGGGAYELVARATDLAGNTAEASAPVRIGPEPVAALPVGAPTAAPTAVVPTPLASQPAAAATKPPASSPAVSGTEVITPTERGTTTYRVTEIKLPTYPYAAYLAPATDPERADYPLFTLDHAAYDASNPQPQPKAYRLLVLENRYLRLGILPDLGGRIYECIFKPTGSNEFYANTVVKPTTWGPGSPPFPEGAAWWTAAGGLEWGFPVEEHGYEFGTVWGFDHASLDDGSIMITLFTKTGPESPYAVVDIILPPDTAYFVVQPRVVNPLGASFKFKFWENAMLAPGKANSVSPDLRLLFPAARVTVHSTGDPSLPQAGQTASWPVINGRDYSRLGNWSDYLGVFATPVTSASGTGAFAAVYDPGIDEGMVRVFPPGVAKGVKLFAPRAGGTRGADGLDPSLWTDDGSTYVELHGGLAPTFADWYTLGPGEEVSWSEYWYPVAKIGGLTFANDRAALSLAPGPAGLRVGLFPTTAVSGRLTVALPGAAPVALDVQLSPEQPLVRDLPLSPSAGQQGPVAVTLETGGETLFEWQGVVQLR